MQDPNTGGAPGGAPAIPLSPSPAPGGAAPSAPASAGEQAKALAGDAAQTASSIADQAKQKLTGALDGQKGAAADLVENFAQTVQRSGEQFQGRQDWLAGAIQRGSTELSTLATSLRDKNIGELVDQAQDFARRQPALFMGAALAAGFAVARLGKVVAGDLSRDDLPTLGASGNGPEVANGQR